MHTSQVLLLLNCVSHVLRQVLDALPSLKLYGRVSCKTQFQGAVLLFLNRGPYLFLTPSTERSNMQIVRNALWNFVRKNLTVTWFNTSTPNAVESVRNCDYSNIRILKSANPEVLELIGPSVNTLRSHVQWILDNERAFTRQLENLTTLKLRDVFFFTAAGFRHEFAPQDSDIKSLVKRFFDMCPSLNMLHINLGSLESDPITATRNFIQSFAGRQAIELSLTLTHLYLNGFHWRRSVFFLLVAIPSAIFPNLDTLELGPQCTGLTQEIVQWFLEWCCDHANAGFWPSFLRANNLRNLIISVKGWEPATVSGQINTLKEMYPEVNITIKRVD